MPRAARSFRSVSCSGCSCSRPCERSARVMSSRRRLTLALILSAAVAALEFWGGAASRSLALTTDAVHVCIDVFAFAIALLAAVGATRRANRRKTFGYGRVEVLGALF